MPQHNDFHGEHRQQNTYATSISAGLSDTRSFGPNSVGERPLQQQHYRLPHPIEIGFRNNYAQPLPSTSSIWDGTLPNYDYPNTHLFRSNQENLEGPMRTGTEVPLPLSSWYSNNDGPWIPRGTVPEVPMDHSHSRNQFRSTGTTTPIEPNHPREANSSENGGVPFVYLGSDSGYGTRRSFENASVFSSELLDRNQDCSSHTSHGNDSHSFHPLKIPEQLNERDTSESWGGSQPAASVVHSRAEPLRCPVCGKDVKTKSELKKHDLRHKKPFHCSHPGCTYKKGFSTTNDLDRHTKSKHPSDSRRASYKAYRCALQNCKSASKEWPRLDNFRCHIKRVHQLDGDALEELVRRSEFRISLDNSEPQERPRPSNHMSQTDSRDIRYQKQREFLQDLTILDKVSQGTHRSEEPDDPVSEVFDSSRNLEATGMLRLPNRMGFGPELFEPAEVVQLPQQSFRLNQLEVGSDSGNTGVNNHDVSIKQRHSPATDSEQQDYHEVPGSSAVRIEKVSSILDPTSSDFAESLKQIKGLLERQLEANLNPSFNRAPLPKENVATINSQNVEQMQEVIKMIETLGRKFQEDSSAVDSREPHAKKYPSPEPSEAPNTTHSGVKSGPSVCPICSKFKGLPCQMKKHLKRHSKPYGCTFTDCGKSFGSKNDWKRHENSQHFQSETWRCDEAKPSRFVLNPSSTTPPCGKVFYRKQSYKDHLVKEHRLPDPSVLNQKLQICRIGRNCQNRFWCGFCKELKELKKRGIEAWTERFNHIDDHFEGRKGLKKQRISEWIPIDDEVFETQKEPESLEIVVLDDDDERDLPTAFPQTGASIEKVTFERVEWNHPHGTKKRQNDASESGRPVKTARRSRLEERIICCQCQNAHNPAIVVECGFCDDNHRFCGSCSYVEADPCPRGSDV